MGLRIAEPTFDTGCFVEWEAYPQSIIHAAQRAGYFAQAPVWDDVTTFNGHAWRDICDTILAGYPCQPFSSAGKRRGENDERHLWPDVARIIREVGPRWVFLENVAGHISLGLETVLRDLREMGFDAAAQPFSAAEVGAPHERLRIFIVAYSKDNCRRLHTRQGPAGKRAFDLARGSGGLGNAIGRSGQLRRTDRHVPAPWGRIESTGLPIAGAESRTAGAAVADPQGAYGRGKLETRGTGRGRAGPARDSPSVDNAAGARQQGRGAASGSWPTPRSRGWKGSGPTVIRSDGKSRMDQLDTCAEQGFSHQAQTTVRLGGLSFKQRRTLHRLLAEAGLFKRPHSISRPYSPPTRRPSKNPAREAWMAGASYSRWSQKRTKHWRSPRLNVPFVNWLMGWPHGHALSNCSAMAFALWLRQMRGAILPVTSDLHPSIWVPPAKNFNPPEQGSLF